MNLFADATGDHQWIHVDVERAEAESPYGGPIAHGYMTLSPLAPLFAQVLVVTGGLRLTFAAVVERGGGDKPVCVAEPVFRYYRG